MKESLLGFTTLTVLFGLAWFAANDSVNTIESVHSEDVQVEKTTPIVNHQSKSPENPCDYTQEIIDDMTFSEVFRLCRDCMGSGETFAWKGELYTTNKKDDNINLVEKEDADQLPTPPQTTSVESVVSK